MRALFFVAMCAGCSARSQLDDAPTCTPGDPPVLLATTDRFDYEINALVTDGHRVYVAQTLQPSLWSVDIGTMNVATVDARVCPAEGSLPVIAASGGVYFNDWSKEPNSPLSFVAPDGGTSEIADAYARVFAPSGDVAYTLTIDAQSSIDAITLADGSRRHVATLPGDIELILVTEKFLHVISYVGAENQVQFFSDRRLSIPSGELHDVVTLAPGSEVTVAGPTAVCGWASASSVGCLDDDATEEVFFTASDEVDRVPFVDRHWVYVDLNDQKLARLSLTDGTQQDLIDGTTHAITSFNGCVFAAVQQTQAAVTNIWRVSPPR